MKEGVWGAAWLPPRPFVCSGGGQDFPRYGRLGYGRVTMGKGVAFTQLDETGPLSARMRK